MSQCRALLSTRLRRCRLSRIPEAVVVVPSVNACYGCGEGSESLIAGRSGWRSRRLDAFGTAFSCLPTTLASVPLGYLSAGAVMPCGLHKIAFRGGMMVIRMRFASARRGATSLPKSKVTADGRDKGIRSARRRDRGHGNSPVPLARLETCSCQFRALSGRSRATMIRSRDPWNTARSRDAYS